MGLMEGGMSKPTPEEISANDELDDMVTMIRCLNQAKRIAMRHSVYWLYPINPDDIDRCVERMRANL